MAGSAGSTGSAGSAGMTVRTVSTLHRLPPLTFASLLTSTLASTLVSCSLLGIVTGSGGCWRRRWRHLKRWSKGSRSALQRRSGAVQRRCQRRCQRRWGRGRRRRNAEQKKRREQHDVLEEDNVVSHRFNQRVHPPKNLHPLFEPLFPTRSRRPLVAYRHRKPPPLLHLTTRHHLLHGHTVPREERSFALAHTHPLGKRLDLGTRQRAVRQLGRMPARSNRPTPPRAARAT